MANGIIYSCSNEHVSDISFVATFWSQDTSGTACSASSSDFEDDCGDWKPSTRYQVGDTFLISGKPYTCKANHVSSSDALPSAEQDLYWQAESGKGCKTSRPSTNQCQPWKASTQYRRGDYVVSSSKAYVCTAAHISPDSFDGATNWLEDASGTACAGSPATCAKQCPAWSPSTKYQAGDACLINGTPHVARLGHVSTAGGSDPSGSERDAFWQADSGSGCCAPTRPKRPRTCDGWQASAKFHVGDSVAYGNKSYVCRSAARARGKGWGGGGGGGCVARGDCARAARSRRLYEPAAKALGHEFAGGGSTPGPGGRARGD